MRTRALMSIAMRHEDLMAFEIPETSLNSPYPLERMWLAKSLGESGSSTSDDMLWKLIDDPHLNVSCMALQSIGKRGHSDAVLPIMHWIKHSNHWYAQWYAYQTLKTLQWHQEG